MKGPRLSVFERYVYYGVALVISIQSISWIFTYGPLFVETWDRYSDKAKKDGIYCSDVCKRMHEYGERVSDCEDACHNAHAWQFLRAMFTVAKSFSFCGIDMPCSTALMNVLATPLGALTGALVLVGLPALALRGWKMFSGNTDSCYTIHQTSHTPTQIHPTLQDNTGSQKWYAFEYYMNRRNLRKEQDARSKSLPMPPNEWSVIDLQTADPFFVSDLAYNQQHAKVS